MAASAPGIWVYPGEPGAFAEEAAQAVGGNHDVLGVAGFREVFEAVAAGHVAAADADRPVAGGVLAVLECTVEHHVPGGDHEIVIGRVRHVQTSATPAAPLVFYRGRYTSLAS